MSSAQFSALAFKTLQNIKRQNKTAKIKPKTMTSPAFAKTYVSYLLWVGPMHRENNSKKFTVLLKDQLR